VMDGVVLAGMDYRRFYGSIGRAVYRSDDRGVAWRQSDAGILAASVRSVAFPSGAVFAATLGRGVVRLDAGVWAPLPGEDAYALLTDPQSPGFLLAATSAGLFRSEDGGASWDQLDPTDPRTGKPAEVRSLALGPGGSLLAGARGWIFKSSDRGDSWRATTEVLGT